MTTDPSVARHPAHAGSFYPADAGSLTSMVDRLLSRAERSLTVSAEGPQPRELLGLLVPHASLSYSGPIAALGWLALARGRPATIVLLGTDHGGLADGVAVWVGGPWIGPFGSVAIDERLTERVLALGAPFNADDGAHLDEHSLEVQMPFLARACPTASMVACSVGARSPGAADVAGRLLAGLVREADAPDRRVLLVCSTDFAHYPTAETAHQVGRLMLGPLLALDGPGLLAAEREARRLPGVACGMCGLEPALALVAALRELGGVGAVLGEATSADVPIGDPRRTVGYAAVAFWS